MFLHQCLIPTALSPYPCLHIWRRHWRKRVWLPPPPSSRSPPGWEHPRPPRALFCSLDNSGNQAAPVQAMAQLNTRHKITFFNHLWINRGVGGSFFFNIQHILGCTSEEFSATFLLLDTLNSVHQVYWEFCRFQRGFFVNTSYWWDKCTCKLNKLINTLSFSVFFFPHAFFLLCTYNSVPLY